MQAGILVSRSTNGNDPASSQWSVVPAARYSNSFRFNQESYCSRLLLVPVRLVFVTGNPQFLSYARLCQRRTFLLAASKQEQRLYSV